METKSTLRPRFSLVSLIWMTITAGALLLAFLSYRETQQLRVENQTLRVKLGALDIKDPKKMYARAAQTMEDREWRWRIYLPRKHWYCIGVSLERIPVSGAVVEGNTSTRELEAGEYEIRATVVKDAQGKWQIVVQEPQSKSAYSVDESVAKWVNGNSYDSSGVTDKTEEFDPGQRVEFLRLRQAQKTSYGSTTDPSPCHGLLLWLQEVGNPTPHTAPPPP